MKSSIEYLATQFDLSLFSGYPLVVFLLAGFVFTAIIQSSSATMVITLSALNANIISLEAAAALVIGADLGTTITTVIAALKGIPAKRRVALGHFLFNLVADIIGFFMLYLLLGFLQDVIGIRDPLLTLVFFHSSFNVVGILLFFPFLRYFANFLERRFTGEDNKAAYYINKVTIDKVTGTVPEAALEALGNETRHLIGAVTLLNLKALNLEKTVIKSGKHHPEALQLARRDCGTYAECYEHIKQLEGEIVEFALGLQLQELATAENTRLNRLLESVRNALYSAKCIKDVQHNLEEFRHSDNDYIDVRYRHFQQTTLDFYRQLFELWSSERLASAFEDLLNMMQANRRDHEEFLKSLYSDAAEDRLTELELSTLLNVDREFYTSDKALIRAMKDYVLPGDQAEAFNNVPALA